MSRSSAWRLRIALPAAALALLLACACGESSRDTPAAAGPESVEPGAKQDYFQALQTWKDGRAERLRAEDGWLTLVGLHWLEPGDNDCGADDSLPVPFPAGTAAARVGTFRLAAQAASFRPAPGVQVEIASGEAPREPLAPGEWVPVNHDGAETPDVLYSGELKFYLIQREGRVGVRVKHPDSPVRTGFTGLDYFPVSRDYRIEAEFVPFDPPKQVPIATVIGTEAQMESPGQVRFSIDGRTHTLEPMSSANGRLWFIFKDRTNGKETYGAGRYLYSDGPVGGKVVIDFNRAYNMPCAFTEYATCPLPPRSNWLDVPIEAGEKAYDKGPAH